jgi:hypothetical protein
MTILITGAAGAGKSWFIKELIKGDLKLKPLLLATTGHAAALIGGSTICSYLECNSYEKIDFNKLHKKTYRTIIIDEASMIPLKVWNYLKKSFPQCDFILVGDWNQLPAIKATSIDIKKETFDYAYKLNVIHRQDDTDCGRLVQFLQNILDGNENEVKHEILLRTKRSKKDNNKVVAFHKFAVNEWNSYFNKFDKGTNVIFSREGEFIGTDGKEHQSHYHGRTFVHNERFIVNHSYIEGDDSVSLTSLLDGQEYNPTMEEYSIYFSVAEAMTAHRMQGQTIEGNLTIILRDIMECSNVELMTEMLYVACSRVKNIDNLYFGLLPEDDLDDLKICKLNNNPAGIIEIDNVDLLETIFTQTARSNKAGNLCKDGLHHHDYVLFLKQIQNSKSYQSRFIDDINDKMVEIHKQPKTDQGKKTRKRLIKEMIDLMVNLDPADRPTNTDFAKMVGVSRITISNIIGEMK